MKGMVKEWVYFLIFALPNKNTKLICPMRKYFVLLLFAVLLTPACQPDDSELEPYSLEDTYDCFQAQSWTTTTVDAAIIGDWEWVYYSCFSGEKGETNVGELLLKLKADHELEIYRNGLLDRIATWEVVPHGSENFELETSENIPWLLGDIVICGNVLMFFNSYIDGCDNYFEGL